MDKQLRFKIGQPIHHKLLDYRGVIIAVDPNFGQSEIWYEIMTSSNPPKDIPWYYILADDSDCTSYVCEHSLEPDLTGKPIANPSVNLYFKHLERGLYKK